MTKEEFQKRFFANELMFKTYAWRLTANRQLEAEDLLQESLLNALKGLHNYKEEQNFNAWVHTVIRNTFINDYRKRVKNPQITGVFDFAHPSYRIYPFGLECPEIIINDYLNENEKLVVNLRHEGFMYREISKKLNLPLETVKTIIHRLRKRLSKNNVREKLYNT